MRWQDNQSLRDPDELQTNVKGLLDADKIGSGFRVAKDVLGIIGQGVAEAITGGEPKSFLVEPPLPTRLRTDIYLPETDTAVEVKAGGSKVEEYQILKYQKGLFSGGFNVMFVQNPFNGEIGPDIGDFIVLRQTKVAYSQVWFTGVRSEPLGKHSRSRARSDYPHPKSSTSLTTSSSFSSSTFSNLPRNGPIKKKSAVRPSR